MSCGAGLRPSAAVAVAIASNCGSDLTPSPVTSICQGYSPKKEGRKEGRKEGVFLILHLSLQTQQRVINTKSLWYRSGDSLAQEIPKASPHPWVSENAKL